MTLVMRVDELSVLPNDLMVLHHHHLNLRQKNSTEVIDQEIFTQWSIHLALFLNQSADEIEAILAQLYEAYQSKNIEYSLKIINRFLVFPGYPFLTRVNFVEHINYICHYLGLAIQKDIPKVPIFAFHKTASSFISVVFCRLFDVLPTVLSFDHFSGMPAWVNAFSKWGGVVHDHYYPSQPNLDLLYEAGIKKCVIHTRHPVDTLVSFAFHMVKINSNLDKEKVIDETARAALVRDYLDSEMETFLRYYGEWLRAWRREAISGRMEIIETTYEDMRSDQLSFFKKILAFYNINYQEQLLEKILQDLHIERNGYNYRKASNNEWQKILTSAQIKKIKKIVNEEFPAVNF